MITTNYQGNSLPANYGSVVAGDSRSWLVQLWMNGSQIECGIKSLEIDKGSCGSDAEFSIGNVISSTLKAELLELTDGVKNEDIEVRIGLEINGFYEWIKAGVFTISEAKKTLYSTSIVGYGKLVSESGKDFPDLTAPTLAQVAYYIGVELGCTVTLDSRIDGSLVIGQPMVGLKTYQAIQILANTVGGYAIDTADGNVKICLFDDTPVLSINSGMMTSLPEVEEQDFEITGIRVTVSDESMNDEDVIPAVGYESTTPINLLCNNPYMTQALFDDMEGHIVGYTYRPAEINLTLGDPRLEGNDVVSVADADGTTYIVPCHSVKHIYDGGLHTEIVAVRPTNSEDGVGMLTPLQSTLNNLSSGVVTAKVQAGNAQNIAKTTKQHFWFWDTIPTGADPLVGTGAHISEVPEADFNDPTSTGYHSGGNLLARSNGIAVRDGLTELATFSSDSAQIGEDYTYNLKLSNGALSFNNDNDKLLEITAGTTEYAHSKSSIRAKSDLIDDGIYFSEYIQSGVGNSGSLYISSKAKVGTSTKGVSQITLNSFANDGSPLSVSGYASVSLQAGASLSNCAEINLYGSNNNKYIELTGDTTIYDGDMRVDNGHVRIKTTKHMILNGDDETYSEYNSTNIHAEIYNGTCNLYLIADGYTAFYVGDENTNPAGRMYLYYDHLLVSGYIQTSSYVRANSGFYCNNNTWFHVKNTGGTDRIVCGINSSNQYMFGYSSYANNEGSSYFDGNVVNIRSKGAVNVNAGGNTNITGGNLVVDSNRIKNKYAYDNTTTYQTNVYINSAGYYNRTTNTSSKRYKHDIKDVVNKELDPHHLYDIEVKQFKYNEDVITDKEDCRYGKDLIGFISEQVKEHYPIAVDINGDGECEAWHQQYIIPPMLALIQEQHEAIENLKEEIKSLRRMVA